MAAYTAGFMASVFCAVHSRIEADNIWGKGPETSGGKIKIMPLYQCCDAAMNRGKKHGTAGWNYAIVQLCLY